MAEAPIPGVILKGRASFSVNPDTLTFDQKKFFITRNLEVCAQLKNNTIFRSSPLLNEVYINLRAFTRMRRMSIYSSP